MPVTTRFYNSSLECVNYYSDSRFFMETIGLGRRVSRRGEFFISLTLLLISRVMSYFGSSLAVAIVDFGGQ